jgi:hypothetical protein
MERPAANDHPFRFLFIRSVHKVVPSNNDFKAGGPEFRFRHLGLITWFFT